MMQIQEAEKSNLGEINQIIRGEFPYTKKSELPIEERFNRKDFKFFKLVENNKIAAFIELNLNNGTAFIRGLAVVGEYRGKGYADELLEYSVKFLLKKNISVINLLVKKENKIAKNLYKKFGFKKIGELDKKIDGSTIEMFQLFLVQ